MPLPACPRGASARGLPGRNRAATVCRRTEPAGPDTTGYGASRILTSVRPRSDPTGDLRRMTAAGPNRTLAMDADRALASYVDGIRRWPPTAGQGVKRPVEHRRPRILA
jgi:hypothetical protein